MKVKVYQWLKGDGNSWIDTKYSLHVGNEFKITLKDVWVNGVRQYANHENKGWGQGGTINISGGLRTRLDMNDYNNYRIYYQGVSDFLIFPIKDEPYTEKITISKENIVGNVYDGDGDTIVNATTKFNGIGANTLYLYRDNHTPNVAYPGIKLISNATISENGSEVLHLVPCLTEQGEACMLNLLSGELYRNQGSGNFSVEGEMLYEFETPIVKQVMRKPNVVVRLREYLVPNGGVFQLPYSFSTSIWEYRYQEASVVSFNDLIGSPTQGVMINRNMGYWDANIRNWVYANEKCGDMVAFKAVKDVGFYCNNEKINTTNPPAGTHRNFTNAFTAPIHRIIQDNIYLVPCDILYHPTLPPQSAMIDPSTGTIYTNQGTGQFSCEGADLGIWTDTLYDDMRIKDVKADMVCIMQNGEPRVVYERTQPFIEHKWLVGDYNAIIEVDYQRTINTKIQSKIRINKNNIAQYTPPFGSAYFGYIQWLFYYNKNNGKWLYRRRNDYDVLTSEENITITDTEDKLTVNGVDIAITDSIGYAPKFGIMNCGGEDTIKSPVDMQYFRLFENGTEILHLTPIQLTRNLFPHEIASSNSALRGECGFADKEKYLKGEAWFYGNKATSGSFSVSDE